MNYPAKHQKLVLIAVTLLLLLSYPLISLFDKKRTVNGIPMLFLYIFFLWISTIIFVWMVSEYKRRKQ